MDWKSVNTNEGRLFKVHNFTFMYKGATYHLEVDEFSDGTFSGHGEHSTDKSNVLESVSGSSIKECLEAMIAKITGS